MDIRGRCCPFQNKKEFLKCGAMLDTAFFHFENDYDIQKQLDKTENSDYENIIKVFLKKIGIKEYSWLKLFTYMFIDKYNEDNEITQDKDNIKELKDLLVVVEPFRNKRGIDLWYVKDLDISIVEDYEFKTEFSSWYFNMKRCYNEFDNKINNKQRTNNKDIENEIKELYKKLDDKHTKFFQEKHFNKFQFRCGSIIQGCFMNDYDYQTFAVSKVTKTYIEAYPIYYDGRCGDVRKFTKPSQFKRFVYDMF
jgi:hypothetical protein